MNRDKSGVEEQAVRLNDVFYRWAKPKTETFYNRSEKDKKTNSQLRIDPKEEKQMLQSMYLAAIEPMFSPTAAYRRASMDSSIWEHVYGNERLGLPYWQLSDLSESLVLYWDSISHRLGVTDSLTRQSFYVLVPMCGCSKDLIWLYSQGVFVTGVDYCDKALQSLMANHPELRLQVNLQCGVKFAMTRDRRLRIFVCNFFTCPLYLDHQYNFVWDRCAFSCINVEQRKAYVKQLMHCRAENFHMLIETFEYNPVLFSLLPHPAFPAEIQELLGSHLRTENVSRAAAIVDWKAASRQESYHQLFERQNLPRDDEPLTVTVQVTLLCNEV